MIYLYVIGWLVCGAIAAGLMNNWWWNAYPILQDEKDRIREIKIRSIPNYIMGPMALLVALIWYPINSETKKHSIKLKLKYK